MTMFNTFKLFTTISFKVGGLIWRISNKITGWCCLFRTSEWRLSPQYRFQRWSPVKFQFCLSSSYMPGSCQQKWRYFNRSCNQFSELKLAVIRNTAVGSSEPFDWRDSWSQALCLISYWILFQRFFFNFKVTNYQESRLLRFTVVAEGKKWDFRLALTELHHAIFRNGPYSWSIIEQFEIVEVPNVFVLKNVMTLSTCSMCFAILQSSKVNASPRTRLDKMLWVIWNRSFIPLKFRDSTTCHLRHDEFASFSSFSTYSYLYLCDEKFLRQLFISGTVFQNLAYVWLVGDTSEKKIFFRLKAIFTSLTFFPPFFRRL